MNTTATVVDDKQKNTVVNILRRELLSAVQSVDEFLGSLDGHVHLVECAGKAWATVRAHSLATMEAMTKDQEEVTRIALAPTNGKFFALALGGTSIPSTELVPLTEDQKRQDKEAQLAAVAATVATGLPKKLGRPKGSKNKPKTEGVAEAPKKLGRPKGSKNKPKPEATRAPRTTKKQAQKHALIAYSCPCGEKDTHGNGFFKHASRCKTYQALVKAKGADAAKAAALARAVKQNARKLRATG